MSDPRWKNPERLADYRNAPSAAPIIRALDSIQQMLLRKNALYQNSALKPVRIFSKSSPEEQLLTRLDDKLSRLLSTSAEFDDEDVIDDIIGYLVLLKVMRAEGEIE